MALDQTTILELRDRLLASGRRPTAVLSDAYETLAREGLLGPEESAALGWVEPVAEAMFLALAADGTIAEPERDVLRGAVRDLTDGAVRSGTIAVMLESLERRLADEGRAARLGALADVLAGQDAEAAFALAAAVALADGAVSPEEGELMVELGIRLGVPAERRDAILAELARHSG